MAVAELTLLGGFEIKLSGQAIDLPGQKDRALLAFLALSPGFTHSRDKLASLLWSDRGDQQARDSLKHALTRVRQCLRAVTPAPIVADRQSVRFDPVAVTIDVAAFERLLSDGTPEALEQAAALYRGDLLDGIGLRDPAFEDWLLVERQRLRQRAEEALSGLLAQSLAAGARDRAAAAARRLLSLDPLREAACRGLMQIHADRAETAQALKVYETLRDRLHRELVVKPEAETVKLYESIRQRRAASAPVAAAPPPAPMEEEPKPAAVELPLLSKPSIAVLPFTTVAQDPEQETFADGLTEDLITDLSRSGAILVTARNSCFAYKGKAIDVRRIAGELGVRYVLEGSARRASQRVRINVQLIDAVTGNHLWAERYDRSLDDVFSVQDEVTAKIVEALAGRLVQRRPRTRPKSMEAWDCCVIARRLNEQSPLAAREARVLLERALEIDPDYAEAHRWLAMNLSNGWLYWGEPIEPTRRLSLEHASRAVQLDPNDSGCHWVHATILCFERKFGEAEQEFAKALELDPEDADCWAAKSDISVLSGHPQRGLEEAERAFLLNPISLVWYHILKGQALYALGRYDEAVQTLRQDTTYRLISRRYLAASLAQLGRMDEARREAKLFMATNPEFRISHWASTQPYQDKALLEKIVDGYRKAGLPE